MIRDLLKLVGTSLVVSLVLVSWQSGFTTRPHMLSDVLFLTGLLLLLSGAGRAVSNSGLFDIVSYGNKRFMDLVLNRPRKSSAQEIEFAQYVHRQRKKHNVHLPVVGGLVCLLGAFLAVLASQ